MISISSRGSIDKTRRFLDYIQTGKMYKELDHFGKMGVDALSRATPIDTTLTSKSWTYEIVRGKTSTGITWMNTNVQDGVNIAIILQYGHGTGTGGYVAGYDYINPALRPIFDKIANDVWHKITTA
jgi:hypothetical protein